MLRRDEPDTVLFEMILVDHDRLWLRIRGVRSGIGILHHEGEPLAIGCPRDERDASLYFGDPFRLAARAIQHPDLRAF